MGNTSAISGRTLVLSIENTAMAPTGLSSKDMRLNVGSDVGGGIGGPLPEPWGPRGKTHRSKQGTSTPEEQDSRGEGTTFPSTPLPVKALKSDQLQKGSPLDGQRQLMQGLLREGKAGSCEELGRSLPPMDTDLCRDIKLLRRGRRNCCR